MTTPAPTASTTEADRIADQLERAFEGDAWNGPTLTDNLSGISADQAAARPLPSAHSIWEIVLHTAAWLRIIRMRLQGESVYPVPDEDDWPPITDTSEAAWAQAIGDLRNEYELLRDEALAWKERDLSVIPDGAHETERFNPYEMFHGVIQHLYYHAGQIAVLKKAETGAPR